MQELEQYLNYLNNNQYPNQDIFYKLMEQSKQDKALEHLLYQLPNATVEERNNLVKQYLDNKKTKDDEEEIISQVFNIDTSLINHFSLQSGKEIFTFYHPTLLKQIVLENNQTKNLAEQLKKWKEEHPENDNNLQMLQEQRLNNGELQFIPVDKIGDYQFLIDKLRKEEKEALDYLLKNKDSYEIKDINIENVIGMDNKGQIIESYLDTKNMEFRIEKPKENIYSNQNQEINVDNKLNSEVTNELLDDNTKMVSTNFDEQNEIDTDIDKQLEAEGFDKDKIAFIKDKLELYDQYPELLNYLTEEDFKFYQKYLNIYRKNQELQKERGYQKQYKMDNKSGYADVLILSLITSFFGGMFITILLALIQYK